MKKPSISSRPNIYQTVTDRILSSLKAGVIPWEKPWQTPHFTGGPFPRNFRTGKPYRGINVFLLWSSPYNSPFWLTFKQAQELKGTVRKGEKGTQIVFYKQLGDRRKEDESTREEDDRAPFVLCYYTVFNVEQCDGLTLPQVVEQPTTAPEIDADETCEAIVTGWENPRPSSDQCDRVPRVLPAKHRFRPHARPLPLRGCAPLLQHSVSRASPQHRPRKPPQSHLWRPLRR